jgi:hypothetical protein
MRFLVSLLTVIVLSGCALIPGNVSFKQSQVDGTKSLYMMPGWFGSMKIGASKNSSMDTGSFYLTIVVPWLCSYNQPTLVVFKIDDELFHFQGGRVSCEIDASSQQKETSTYISVKREFITKLINARIAYVKWGSSEQKMSRGPTTAHSGLQKFLAEADRNGLK